MSNRGKKIFVALSGGVDSSVAAALLKEEGYEVTGVHMICWEGCENNEDKQDALRVAATLNIPFLVFDFRKEYKQAVFDYMVREYEAGRTPNPDVMCNKEIKFGIFLRRARAMGADYVATGHYVRNELSSSTAKLAIAKDTNKDQSYFLWTLTQDQLRHALFPIGGYLKSEVRELARKFNLPTSEKKDSQGLCFVGKVDFFDFLKSSLPVRAGSVLDESGAKIGEHEGAHFYTIGQRHGLGIGGSTEPLYIAEKDIARNTVVVARARTGSALFAQELVAQDIHWISGVVPKFPLSCLARIRYRQPLQEARIDFESHIRFTVPQRAIAPGQSVVFYKGNSSQNSESKSTDFEMLGGGIIALG